MPKPTDDRPGSAGAARALATTTSTDLRELLDAPDLARVVPRLTPGNLYQLVRHEGPEACAEVIAYATPAQIATVLDLDLWRGRTPGADAAFDAARFGEWIEALVEAGASTAARIVASLDVHLVITGLSRQIRVLDVGIFEPTYASDDERPEQTVAPPSGLSGEVGGYVVHARDTAVWDAIVTLLVTLEVEFIDTFHTIMRGCRALSNSTPEIDGLDDLLMAPDQALHDLGLARKDRQAQQGYVAPADARVFLHTARHAQRARPRIPSGMSGAAEDRSALVRSPRCARLQAFLAALRERDTVRFAEESGNLAFLANTLIAGCSVQSRAFTAPEASEAVFAVCNLGLEYRPEATNLRLAFEVGWAALHQEIGMFAATRLSEMLRDLRSTDADIQRGLAALQRALTAAVAACEPWRAREALDAIAMLDAPIWVALLGLLDECPMVTDALAATLERRTTATSAAAFDFISTSAQIDYVRRFVGELPGLLARSVQF
jgi:hypothetical protein